MTTPVRPDTALYGTPRSYNDTTSLYGPPRAFGSDASAMAGASGKGKMTWEQAARAAAAGILPGISDEVIGFLKAASRKGKPLAQLIDEATDEERAILREARTMAGSGVLENLSAVLTGVGLTKLATKGVPVVSKVADFLVGGVGKGAPATAIGAAGQGFRAGSRIGAIGGLGNADNGSAVERILGGAGGFAAGGAIGAGAGALTTAILNRLPTPGFNPADAAQVFPLETPAKVQRQAIGELSDAQGRGGVTGEQARARAAALGPEGVYADVGGKDVLRTMTKVDAMSQSRGNGAADVLEGKLAPRAMGRADRRAGAVATATGSSTAAFPNYVKTLREQKTALDNIMFDRFRREAATYVKRNPLKTTLDMKEALMDPTFMREALDLEAEMATNQATKLGDAYVSPYVVNAKNEVIGVRNELDPGTMARLSNRLGNKVEALRANPDTRRLTRAPAKLKQDIDNLLEQIPTYREANVLSKRMNDRITAAKEGYQRSSNLDVNAIGDVKQRFGGTKIPLPSDVKKFLASGDPSVPGALTGMTELGSAWGDYQAGAQTARVKPLVGAKKPASAAPMGSANRDAAIFGPDEAARIQAADAAEATMARTEMLSPSAQGRIAPGRQPSPAELATEAAGNALRTGVRFEGGVKGTALGLLDIARTYGRYGLPPNPERLTGIAQGMVAPPTPVLNLIDQIRAASNTPARRGLLGGFGYASGGLFGDNRNQ